MSRIVGYSRTNVAITRWSPGPLVATSVLALELVLVLAVWPALSPRAHADETPKWTAEQLVFFEQKIRPVLVEHCYACHSEAARAKGQLKGGLVVDSRAGLLAGGDSGAAVTPLKPDDSLLIGALKYDSFEMPPKGQLPPQVIADFETWIKGGAADPRDGRAVARRPVIDIQAGRQHWSYQLPVRPTPPATQDQTWPESPIDAHVLAELERREMTPTSDADRTALIRRLYFDLVGLPPTPTDIDEFLGDTAPDAYQRLVERLLASPRMGERWGRHWLDVARFAESLTLRGFVLSDAWRYRDYVVQTLNRDRPYDQFVVEQVAGDLLAADDIATRQRQVVATTYLMLGNTNLEEQDKRQLRMDVVDEQLETIGKGLLAQTLGCARCHDHKFDPIPTRDYYALAGILRSTKSMEHSNVSKWLELPLPLPPDEDARYRRHEEQVAALQSRIKQLKDAAKTVAATTGTNARPEVVAPSALPGIVLDDAQARKVGEWKESKFHGRYVGKGYVHDLDTGKGDKTLTFQPEIPKAGKYEVRLAYTPGANRSTAVPVTVFSADGEQTITVNQQEDPPLDGRFVSLGQFRFESNGQGFVIVSNEGTKGHVIADAVQWLPVDATATAPTDSARTPTIPAAANAPVANTTGAKPIASSTTESPAPTDSAEQLKRLEAELKQLSERGPKRPTYISVREEDADELGDTQVHIRGIVHNLGDSVPRGFLQVATYGAAPTIPERQSGRKELGLWLASRDNPLTARVMANRVWHWMFGAGLVRTTDNFGSTGEAPSHPALLDALAVDFMDRGWSVKSVVRDVALSRTYRLAESNEPRRVAADPENRWLGRASHRRLDAESILDTILTISGQIRFEVGGPLIKSGTAADYGYRHDTMRRALYWPVLRNAMPELLEAFDAADPSMVTGRRSVSTVAPQALLLMNHPFIWDQSLRASRRLLADSSLSDDSARLTRAYRESLGREPTDNERSRMLAYLTERRSTAGAKSTKRTQVDEQAWGELFQVLIASVDFRYQ